MAILYVTRLGYGVDMLGLFRLAFTRFSPVTSELVHVEVETIEKLHKNEEDVVI